MPWDDTYDPEEDEPVKPVTTKAQPVNETLKGRAAVGQILGLGFQWYRLELPEGRHDNRLRLKIGEEPTFGGRYETVVEIITGAVCHNLEILTIYHHDLPQTEPETSRLAPWPDSSEWGIDDLAALIEALKRPFVKESDHAAS